MRVFDIGGPPEGTVAHDRVLTVPNLLSLLRLLALPLIHVDLVEGRIVRALVVLAVVSATDWFDGYLARRLDQASRLGKLLDPLSDRLLFVVVGVGMVRGGLLPLWALVVLLARDVTVLIAGSFLVARGRAVPEPSRLGKASTMGLMIALPLFLLAAVAGGTPTDPQPQLHAIAWATFLVNLVLHYAAAVGYARRPATP
jgi:cardiolipin synthase